jgi:Papain family cysteine protease
MQSKYYPYLFLLFAGLLFAFYWFFAKEKQGNLARGLLIDAKIYDSVEVFMPLDSADMLLPEGVSLEQYCPRPRNQGDQNSCVGWSIAYAARTIVAAKASGLPPNQLAFSPAFLFNQISFGSCEGAYIPTAFEKIRKVGLLGLAEFPYSDKVCDKQPSVAQINNARAFRIAGYSRLTKSKTDYSIDTAAIKQCLTQGMPVIIGCLVTASFEGLTEKIWQPDADETVLGGHAMCVVGYNNAVDGGAFRVLNSWGTDWADKGFVWIRYADFVKYCKEAYTIQPLPNKAAEHQFALEMTWLNAKNAMKVTKKANVFVPENADEKAENTAENGNMRLNITNKTKQYFYLIAQQEGKPSIVIFPAEKGASAYLGLCGKRTIRIYNKNNNTQNVGLQSIVAVSSKKPLNTDSLCLRINAQPRNTLIGNIQKILQPLIDPNTQISALQNKVKLQTDSTAYSVAIVPFVLPAAPLVSAAPTFQDALKNPIDSLVLACANVKTTAQTISFDITARTSRHTAWDGYFNQLEVEVEYDANIVQKTLAQTATQSLSPDLIKANYRLIVDYFQAGKLIVKINPKTTQREAFSRRPRTLARLTLPITCKGKTTFLRLSPNGKNSVATYCLTANTPEKGNLSLSYKHTNLRETVVPLRCK